MRSLSAGAITPAMFATLWLAARRTSLERGERVGEKLSRIFNIVFYALDDYPIDPSLREEGDVSDAELLACVVEALQAADSLE